MKNLDINKLLILFLCNLLSPLVLMAQPDNETINKMNNVKSDESLIYGEASHPNENTAYDSALSDLLSYANELRFKNGVDEKITAKEIHPFVMQLSDFDGHRYCIVLYAPKSQITLMVSKSNTSEILPGATTQYSNVEPEGQKKSQNINTPINNSYTDNKPIEDNRYTTPLYSDILKTLCAQDNWIEIKGFLSEYKKNGRYKEYGFCTDISEIPKDAYQILIDDKYGILAILSPQCMTNRINYRTNQPDSEYNYPNCKVYVWFK